MRSHLIDDIFTHLAEKHGFKIDHAPKALKARLEELPLPMSVLRLLQWRWPRKRVCLGPYELYTAEEILASQDLTKLLKAKMIQVGSAPNGDPFVIRFALHDQAEVGLISHDSLYESPNIDPKKAYVAVAKSVDEYLYKVAEDRFLPMDFYSAREFQLLKSELKKRQES